MAIRIAIPEPSVNPEYNGRSLQPYLESLQASGAVPVVIPIVGSRDRVAELLGDIQGVLLPGSRFDVEPQLYNEARIAECNPADAAREAVDALLLRDAFELQKPVLAICYGIQSLNVWRGGTLIQHLETPVNHSPGRETIEAHRIEIAPDSQLAATLPAGEPGCPWVNSSHHQAVKAIGKGLRVTAASPQDGVVEAVELESSEHFVLGVQWHPERTYAVSALSRAIFEGFVEAAGRWRSGRGSGRAETARVEGAAATTR